MYYYIVNPAANHGTINSIQEKLKSNLLRLNIDGEFAKTIGEGDAAKITAAAIKKGVKTIVAVGGDATVNEVLTAVHRANNSNVAIGIIPIGKRNTLASHLQIRDWQQACGVLSARRLQKYSLMKLAEHVFIYSAEAMPAQPKHTKQPRSNFKYLLDVDGKYRVRGTAVGIKIHNQKFLHPELDNQLIARISTQPPPSTAGFVSRLLSRFANVQTDYASYSQLHGGKLTLQSQTAASMLIDGRPIEGKRWEVELSEQQIQLITNRLHVKIAK